MKEAILALMCVGRIGPRLYRRLCDSFGTAEAVLRQDRKTLAGIRGIGAEMADSIVRKSYRRKMDLQLEWMQKHGADYLTPEDGGYPEVLRHIYDAPPLLMYQGALDCVDDTAFAVVGTRHPDDYGKTMSGRIAGGIAEYGICIVSGMAKGVDSIAHREALKRGVPTVAVTGTPLDCIYPAENRMIHAQICEHGAVCSEQLIGDRVMPGNFIRRNRIISGLSRGVVVTQAGTRSGALVTALNANEQNRDVFAVPGNCLKGYHTGCHRLIRLGAKIVEKAEDVLNEYPFLKARRDPQRNRIADMRGLNTDEKALLKLIGKATLHIDGLLSLSGLPQGKLMSVLLQLEIKGYVRAEPGIVTAASSERVAAFQRKIWGKSRFTL